MKHLIEYHHPPDTLTLDASRLLTLNLDARASRVTARFDVGELSHWTLESPAAAEACYASLLTQWRGEALPCPQVAVPQPGSLLEAIRREEQKVRDAVVKMRRQEWEASLDPNAKLEAATATEPPPATGTAGVAAGEDITTHHRSILAKASPGIWRISISDMSYERNMEGDWRRAREKPPVELTDAECMGVWDRAYKENQAVKGDLVHRTRVMIQALREKGVL